MDTGVGIAWGARGITGWTAASCGLHVNWFRSRALSICREVAGFVHRGGEYSAGAAVNR
jgi:hypothetical protein